MPAVADELRRQLVRVAVIGGGMLLAMAAGLGVAEGLVFTLGWLSTAMVCWGVVVWQCLRRLHHNHGPADPALYKRLGHGTHITLLRGLLIAATAGFLTTTGYFLTIETRPALLFVPAALYTVAVLGDALDGYIARRHCHVTRLGAELDTALDALGLLVAPLLAVLYGKLHASYLLVSAAYYLFQWGIHWRHQRGRPVYPLPVSRLRRHLAGLQMAMVAAALWPPLSADVTRVAGVVVMLPLLIGFVRDWRYVSGRQVAPGASSA